MGRIVNLFAGPGVGKSITAAALFAELKYRGHNTELVLEFAKDAAWEGRGPDFFAAQTYITGQQTYRIHRVIDKVEFVITDGPVLQSIAYVTEDYKAQSLKHVIREHHDSDESINILLKRTMPYDPNGRYQNAETALLVDEVIHDMLIEQGVIFTMLDMSRDTPFQIIEIMKNHGWL